MPPTARPISKKEQIEEIIKCGKDPVYFMKRYCKIQHPARGLLSFETYSFQDDCVKQFLEHRLNIVLKSRQLGLSTLAAAYATWLAIFYKDQNILIIATKLPTAMNMIKKCKVILDNLPKWLLLPKFDPTKQAISFNNGSQIVAIPTSEDAGRSEALSLLIVDEAAIIRDFEEIWAGLKPTISTGGKAIVLSTPKGVGGQYYRLWTEAEAGLNGFNPIRLHWTVHPEHDEEWFKNESKGMNKRQIAQEFMCVGGDTRIITPDGYKLANQLSVGDRVLTHKGRFRQVTRVGSRLVEDHEKLFMVSSPGHRKGAFILTGNHPMLTYRFWANHESSFDTLGRSVSDPTWIDAETIAQYRSTTDRIVNVLFPRFTPETEQFVRRIDLSSIHHSIDVTELTCRYPKQWGKTQRYVDVDFELGHFIGLYLAEGCSCRGGIDMGFHKNELETLVARSRSYLEKLGCRVTVNSPTSGNGCRMWTFNQHVGALVKYFISDNVASNGRRAPNKLLNFDRVLECGPDFIKGLLVGHHAGDGNHDLGVKTCAYSTSSRLIYQLRTLNSMFGLYPRIGHDARNQKNPSHSDMWYLEFQTCGKSYQDLLDAGPRDHEAGNRTMFYHGSFVGCHCLSDVSELKRQDGGFTVYDISVADDRSFVAHSAVLHNCDFIASGDTFLQPEELDYMRSLIQSPAAKEGPAHGVWIWSPPVCGHRYIISADVSRGDAHDFSTFHVIDTEDGEICAEYMGKVPPEVLADLLNEYGKRYNNALAIPEQNTFGYFVCVKLRDTLGYKKLYYTGHNGDPFNYIPNDPKGELPGFPTNQKTRTQILGKLEELIRKKQLRSYSQRLFDQMQSFVWDGNRAKASKDSYDDLVMSLAIGSWLLEDNSAHSDQAKAMAYAIMKATTVQRTDINQMPGNINEAQPLVNPNIAGINAHSVMRPKNPRELNRSPYSRFVSDFDWLRR